MSGIIRVSKGKDNPFVMINKLTLTDSALTWEARGVLAYLLSKPDDWTVRVWDLIRQGPGGRQRMQRILNELETAGYMQRRRLRNGNGTFHWETVIYERPTIDQATIGGKPVHGSATHGKPVHILRTDPTNNDPTKNEKKDISSPVGEVREKPSAKEVRGALEDYFVAKTKIPAPARETVKQRKAAAVRWWGPLHEIAKLASQDVMQGKRLIDAALNRMDGLTISAPQSILQVAIAIIGERGRGQIRDGPEIAVGPGSRGG